MIEVSRNYGGFARGPGEAEYPRLWEGLAGVWSPMLGYDGLTTLRDYSGYGKNGTLENSPTWTQGIPGPGLSFTIASSQRVNFGDVLSQTGNFSVVTIFQASNIATANQVLIARSGALAEGYKQNYFLYLNTSKLLWQWYDGTTATTITGATTLSSNTVYRVVATYDGARGKIFIDGIQDADAAKSSNPTSVSNQRLQIACSDGSSPGNFFGGKIYFSAVYSRTLQPTEAMLYGMGATPLTILRHRYVGRDIPAAGGTTVSVPAGSLTLTTKTPTVLAPRTIAVPAASLTLTGNAPAITNNVSVAVPAGSLALTANAPSVLAPRLVGVPAGSLALTAYAPTILNPQALFVPAGALYLNAYAPVVTDGTTPAAGLSNMLTLGVG